MLVLRVLVAAAAILDFVSASPALKSEAVDGIARRRCQFDYSNSPIQLDLWSFADIRISFLFFPAAMLPEVRIAGSTLATAAGAASNGTKTNGTQTVIVQAGDSLGKIAPKFGVGICDIAKASGIANPNVITPGQVLTIPPPTATPDNVSCLPPVAPPASAGCVPGGPDRFFVPTAGLSAELAAKFLNITLTSFAAANPKAFASAKNGSAAALAATNLTGSSIMSVPVCPNSQCTIGQGTVKSGDIFDTIAAAAGSTTGQILALNPGIDRLNLAVGQTFTLPSKCQNLTAKAAN